MTQVTTTTGKLYEAVLVGPRICLWREATTSVEKRRWSGGFVCRVVTLPCAVTMVACTCEAARFRADGAMGCPHFMPALRWVCSGAAARVQGGESPFAGGAEGTCPEHGVRRDVTGQLSPSLSPLVLGDLSPVSPRVVSKDGV